MPVGNIAIGEYVAAPVFPVPQHVNHSATPVHFRKEPLIIEAEAFGDVMPDSLLVYPEDVSFWREDNRLYTMRKVSPYTYRTIIPADALQGHDRFSYRIVMPGVAVADSLALSPSGKMDLTFPGAVPGNPLDWDNVDGGWYSTMLADNGSPVVLLNAADGIAGLDVSTIPDRWGRSRVEPARKSPVGYDAVRISVGSGSDSVRTVLTKYVWPIVAPVAHGLAPRHLSLRTGAVSDFARAIVSLVDRDGFTFSREVTLASDSVINLPVEEVNLSPTLLVPAPYPTFLGREFRPEDNGHQLHVSDIEKVQLVFPSGPSDEEAHVEVAGIWFN